MPLRYRFADFVVSPARRQLLRVGREVPLIPRYFDLLVLLLERRGRAVHRRDILERVWTDVVVSDGALSQAVRTLRRALGDDMGGRDRRGSGGRCRRRRPRRPRRRLWSRGRWVP